MKQEVVKTGPGPCKCGHDRGKHHHGHSCTELVDGIKLRYCKCEEFREVNSKRGETDMATKKTKRVKKEGKARAASVLYVANGGKLEGSKLAEKMADKDTTSHIAIIARFLNRREKPISAAEIIEAMKKEKNYKTKTKDFTGNVRAALGALKAGHYIKSVDAPAEAA